MREKLLLLGFTNNEAKAYATLCRYESLSGHELAKKTGLDRSVTYALMNNLVQKGAVASAIKGKIKKFFVTDPQNLLREIHMQEAVAEELIKEVRSQKKIPAEATSVEVMEGQVGSRQFYSIIQRNLDKPYYSVGGDGTMLDRLRPYLEYYKKQLDDDADITIITTNNKKQPGLKKLLPSMDLHLTTMKPHAASCNIVGDMIIFHQYVDEPKLIFIKDKHLAMMMTDFIEMTLRKK